MGFEVKKFLIFSTCSSLFPLKAVRIFLLFYSGSTVKKFPAGVPSYEPLLSFFTSFVSSSIVLLRTIV